MKCLKDTICNIATSTGVSAISVIRISGELSISTVKKIFSPYKKDLDLAKSRGYRIYYGIIKKKEDEIVDEVLVSIFRKPHSFTGEDMVEISCHGSSFIQNKIIELLIENNVRLSAPGEFSQRAFLNGKIDLSQAEAIADLINSNNSSAHQMAMQQLRGGYSEEIQNLRQRLLKFASLVELELDFSEEDVLFVDRKELKKLLYEIQHRVEDLCNSFKQGNVFKNGLPVVIVGETNVGKSTLLNVLLKEEKAIVTAEEGTTRDVIEDCSIIKGILFRFMDTAGLRIATNEVEKIGICKTYQKIKSASIILLLLDTQETVTELVEKIKNFKEQNKQQALILVFNKIDKINSKKITKIKNAISCSSNSVCFISAKKQQNVDDLITLLLEKSSHKELLKKELVVSNLRHFEALNNANKVLQNALISLDNNIPTDLITQDIKDSLQFLGEITGKITSEEILQNIFSTFCIGK